MRASIVILVFLTAFCAYGDAACVLKKLNGAPVCFGARNNEFGSFVYRGPAINAYSFTVRYRSGYVTCHKPNKNARSHWGCAPNNRDNPGICVYLTNCKNKVIAPKYFTPTVRNIWYKIPGYTSSSPALVFPLDKPVRISTTDELRLWYGEDLYGWTEGDNGGRTCADVYALV